MASEVRDGQIVPTAMNKQALEEALGTGVKVCLDSPTRGYGSITVKRRCESEQKLHEHLATLLDPRNTAAK